MRFLPAGMENQIAIEVLVRNEFTVPSSNLMGVLTVDAVSSPVTIPQGETTTYFLTVPAVSPARGSYSTVKLHINAQTPIGLFRALKTYLIFDYTDLLADYDTVRTKLGITSDELYDEELSLETAYLNLFNLLKPEFHVARDADSELNYKFSQLVAVTAALTVAPHLPMRLAKKDATENGEFNRLGNASDIGRLMDALTVEQDALWADLTGYMVTPFTTAPAPVLQFLALSPDRITGA